jgi:hypothetical protein
MTIPARTRVSPSVVAMIQRGDRLSVDKGRVSPGSGRIADTTWTREAPYGRLRKSATGRFIRLDNVWPTKKNRLFHSACRTAYFVGKESIRAPTSQEVKLKSRDTMIRHVLTISRQNSHE